MSKSFRLGVVLLSAAAAVALSNPQTAFGQQIKGGIGSNQSSKNKDKDDDDKDHKDRDKDKRDKKDKKEQGNSNNQGGNQGNNQNAQNNNSNNNNQGNLNNKGGNPPTSNNPPKVNNSNSSEQFKQLLQKKNQNDNDKKDRHDDNDRDQDKRDKDRRDDDNDHRNQGPGGLNKIGIGQPGFPNQNPNLQKVGVPAGNGPGQPINKQFGSWKGDQWQGSHKADNWSKAFGHKKPFSSEWYSEHPRAWKYDNRKSTVWVAATVPGVYTWLNWGSVPQQYQVGYNNGPRFDPSLYGEWYPLGVYSLMTGPDDVGMRVLQLAVDRRGRINGNYFDMITDSDHSVSGVIDRQTQRAEWSLNQNPNVQFRASIMRLLQPYGTITVQVPGGEQRWQFVRLEND